MKRFIVLLWLLLNVCMAHSQSNNMYIKLSGQLVDSTSSAAIPYATIQAVDLKAKQGYGGITDANGMFSFEIEKDKKYILKASCIGYLPRELSVSVENQSMNIGKIGLREVDIQLSEVTVTARKKRISLTPAGLTYDMKSDPMCQSGDLLFALRAVPMVDVDGEGNIRVKGSPSYSIYMNGKPYRIATLNPKEVLKSIPAKSITKVEIITQLDAHHDADTGNAIINIITDKKRIDGYQIMLNGSGETHPKAAGGTSLIMTKGKVDFSLSYNYNYTHETDQTTELHRKYHEEDHQSGSLDAEGYGNGTFQNHVARGMLNVNIDSVNTIYADVHVLQRRAKSEQEVRQIYEKDKKQYSKSKEMNDLSSGASEFNLIYQNLYKKDKSDRLTLGYRYAYNPDKRHTTGINYSYQSDVADWEQAPDETSKSKDASDGGLHEHTLQVDYRLPLNQHHTLRIGGKDIYRKAGATPKYQIWNDETQSWEVGSLYQQTNVGKMNQTQNIAEAYLTYAYNRGKWAANFGGRISYSHNRIEFAQNPQANFTSSLFDFIPRCNLSYELSQNSQLNLSFSSSVKRPSIWNLNPFKQQLNEYQLTYGNPDLKSEKDYDTDLSYSYYNNKCFVNVSLGYSETKDAIVQYPFRDENNPKLLIYTYGNVGKYRKAGSSFYISYTPIKEMAVSVDGSIAHHSLKSQALDVNQKELNYNLSVSCNANLAQGWLMGGKWSIFKQAPTVRTTYKSFQMHSFYLYKLFLDNTLSVGLVANQPFMKRFNTGKHYTGYNFEEDSYNHIKSRSFALKLSYSFGSGKRAKIKRNRAIQNEDLLQSTGVR